MTTRLDVSAGRPLTRRPVTGAIESTRKVAVAVERLPARSATWAAAVCVPWERSAAGTKAAEDAVTAAWVVTSTPSKVRRTEARSTPLTASA